jgi:hypothetical protein
MKWFRLYDTVLDDPKVQRLKPELFKAWINLLCIASRKDGQIPVDPDDLGFMLRCDPETAERWLVDLIDAGLIELRPDHATPHQWDEYQFVSDNSTERVRAFRQRKKTPGGHDPDPKGGKQSETFRQVSDETKRNALESESESESETLDSDSDSDAKIAIGPWKRPAISAEDEGTRRQAVRMVEAFFSDTPEDCERIRAHLTNQRLVPDPKSYAETCIANAVRKRRHRPPKPAASVPIVAKPAALVWVCLGSPAWDAWERVDPQPALPTRDYPGERGRWRRSEYPQAPREARA